VRVACHEILEAIKQVHTRREVKKLGAEPGDQSNSQSAFRKQLGLMLSGRWFARSELQRMLRSIHDIRGNYRVDDAKRDQPNASDQSPSDFQLIVDLNPV